MLNKAVTDCIRESYKTLQDQLPGFIPRRAQNYLVAEIAKSLAGEYSDTHRMIVAEAGTGIGKSLAYLLSVIPFAKLNNKKVVISTATVALQEQLGIKTCLFIVGSHLCPSLLLLQKEDSAIVVAINLRF